MGKITVKHYLNTKVIPSLQYGEFEIYPVYIQITINRKTTQIKSLTELEIGIKEWSHFIEYNELTGNTYEYGFGISRGLTIFNEVSLVKKSIEFISKLRNEVYNISENDIRKDLSLCLEDTAAVFLKTAYEIRFNDIIDYRGFALSFSNERSLFENLFWIEKYLNIDISKLLPKEILIFWFIVFILTRISKNQSFIDWYSGKSNEIILDFVNNGKYTVNEGLNFIEAYIVRKHQIEINTDMMHDINNQLIRNYLIHIG